VKHGRKRNGGTGSRPLLKVLKGGNNGEAVGSLKKGELPSRQGQKEGIILRKKKKGSVSVRRGEGTSCLLLEGKDSSEPTQSKEEKAE